jgi:hypothetical protein
VRVASNHTFKVGTWVSRCMWATLPDIMQSSHHMRSKVDRVDGRELSSGYPSQNNFTREQTATKQNMQRLAGRCYLRYHEKNSQEHNKVKGSPGKEET